MRAAASECTEHRSARHATLAAAIRDLVCAERRAEISEEDAWYIEAAVCEYMPVDGDISWLLLIIRSLREGHVHAEDALEREPAKIGDPVLVLLNVVAEIGCLVPELAWDISDGESIHAVMPNLGTNFFLSMVPPAYYRISLLENVPA